MNKKTKAQVAKSLRAAAEVLAARDPMKYKVPSIEELMADGYTRPQAELIHRNIEEKADTHSWSPRRVAAEQHKYPRLSDKLGEKRVKVYRVVPRGVTKINVGDYVFLDKRDAESFRYKYGFIRGQPNIISMSAPASSFILPHKDDDELIFTGSRVVGGHSGAR